MSKRYDISQETMDTYNYAKFNTSKGTITVKLYPNDAPNTVANFAHLVNEGFYNGLKFHRVTSKANGDSGDFMIQGGCPLNDGMGGPGYEFSDEFPKDKNGTLLFRHNVDGVISMANSGKNTNGSQFFITLVPVPHLNGVHTVFGNVEEGLNIVKDSVVQNTIIKTIQIIRVGRDAKRFDAPKVFLEELTKSETSKQAVAAKIAGLKKMFLEKMSVYKSEALETPSELKFYLLKKGDGPKPRTGAKIRIHYSAFFANGDLLDTNRKEIALEYGTYNEKRDEKNGYQPFSSTYSMQEQLIQGFKEGLQKMKFGDRAVLFIPYHLAYGENGGRGIPPKSDLIFELEMYPNVAE